LYPYTAPQHSSNKTLQGEATSILTQGGLVRETRYEYQNGTGNLKTKTQENDPYSDRITTYDEYDSYGNVKYITIDNCTTEFTYDPTNTYVETEKNPKGHVVSYLYDYRFGKIKEKTDANNKVWTYIPDEFGRNWQIISPDGGKTIFQYFDEEFPRKLKKSVYEGETDSGDDSYIDSFVFVDGFGRNVQTVTMGESDPIITRFSFDDIDRKKFIYGPYFGHDSEFVTVPREGIPLEITQYDYRRRPLSVRSLDDYWGWIDTSYEYDGFKTTIIDADESRKSEIRDYLGNIIEVVEYNGSDQYHTNYEYSVTGELTRVLDDLGHETTIAYDLLGQKTNMTNQDMGSWDFTYDVRGNLETQTDENGQEILFSYDSLNRLIYKEYVNPTQYDNDVSYCYDSEAECLGGINSIGRLTKVDNGVAVSFWDEYDELGRTIKLSKTINGDQKRTTGYEYDKSGKVKKITYPDNEIAEYQYHYGTGLLDNVFMQNELDVSFSGYKPKGKIGKIRHNISDTGGIETEYIYDNR
jgi:YD repeat-containing protein